MATKHSSSELRLQSCLDSTEIAFDTIFNYSTLITLAKHATYRLPDTTTIPTDATYAVTCHHHLRQL